MPKVGTEEFDYTIEGIAEAEAYSEATGIPVSNAQDRNVQTYIHGGMVNEGVTGQLGTPSISPSPITPSISPVGGLEQSQMGMPGYKKGGKVKNKKSKGY
jgi:hypothetical protein